MCVPGTFDVSTEDVFITSELDKRAPKLTDYLQEKVALQDLAARMIDQPEDVLPRFVDLAMDMAGGVSAGLSLFEEHPAPGVFRWQYLRGILSPFNGATTPRNFSPCGITLDRNGPVLSRHPERVYGWIADANIVVPELLLVPLYLGGNVPLGTLWIVSEEEGHFDSGHARVLTELATFVGIALRMARTEQSLKAALVEKDLLIQEVHHRVKNSLSTVHALLTRQARTTSHETVARELLESAGRVRIFGAMHEHLYRVGAASRVDIADYLRTLLDEQQAAFGTSKQGRVVTLDAGTIWWPSAEAPTLGLIVVELVTNALKYGTGAVSVTLRQQDDKIVVLVEDEGDGLPPEFDPSCSKGLGMRVITGLLSGRRGQLEIDRSRGHTCFVATLARPPDQE